MKQAAVLASIAALALTGLTACGGVRATPDEFAISRQAPLAVPPDFNLRPPRPGSPRPQELEPQGQALEALFGPGVTLPARTPGEQSLLEGAGALNASLDIRSELTDDGTKVVDKGRLLKPLLDAQPGAQDPAIASIRSAG